MKPIKLLGLALALSIAGVLQSQVMVSLNPGTPPQWGPAGYSDVRYYYLPDVEAYYDNQSSMFIYYSSGKWDSHSSLPDCYQNYDLYKGYKVVLSDYTGTTPYTHFYKHKKNFVKGYHHEIQKTVGSKPGRDRK